MQQIHDWTEINKKANKNLHDGYYWTYNTYEAWQEQFPFWSVNTIIRIFEKLIKNQLIITSNYNKLKFDRTKWYRVNYEKLTEISPFTQNDKMDNANLGRTISETNFTDTISKK